MCPIIVPKNKINFTYVLMSEEDTAKEIAEEEKQNEEKK
jgi:hypothetical protein